MSEMKKLFRPEFLNRLDEIIVFKSLTEEQIAQIVDLMVADLRDRLIAMDMTINLTPEARALVAKEGTDTTMGARPLRRAIQRLLEDPFRAAAAGTWHAGSVIDVGVKDGANFHAWHKSDSAPRKRDSIASEAESFCRSSILSHAGAPSHGGGVSSDGAAD